MAKKNAKATKRAARAVPAPPAVETPQERTLRNQREYYSGWSIDFIAEREGTSRTSVHKRLAKIGTVFRSRGKLSPARASRRLLDKAAELETRAKALREDATHPLAR